MQNHHLLTKFQSQALFSLQYFDEKWKQLIRVRKIDPDSQRLQDVTGLT